MTFNSFEFIFLFLPITITVFYALSRYRQNLAVMWLVMASLVFYGSLSLHSLPLLILSVCVNFCISLTFANPSTKKFWLILGLLFNFGVLGYFKISGALGDRTATIVNFGNRIPGKAAGICDVLHGDFSGRHRFGPFF